MSDKLRIAAQALVDALDRDLGCSKYEEAGLISDLRTALLPEPELTAEEAKELWAKALRQNAQLVDHSKPRAALLRGNEMTRALQTCRAGDMSVQDALNHHDFD